MIFAGTPGIWTISCENYTDRTNNAASLPDWSGTSYATAEISRRNFCAL